MRLIDADELVEALDEAVKERTDIMDALRKQLLVGFAKQILSDAPTVDAIPIERIKDWIKTEPLGMGSLIAPEYTIAALLYWWEKENE